MGERDWCPRECCWCGKRIRMSRDSWGCEFDYRTGTAYAWHTSCGNGPRRDS